MSCHTWFAKKLSLPIVDKSEMKDIILFSTRENLLYGQKQLKEFSDETNEWLDYIDWHETYLKEFDSLNDLNLIKGYLSVKGIPFHEENGEFYQDVVEYHNVFRQKDYNAPSLYSLSQTLEFIKTDCFGYSYYDNSGNFISENINIEILEEFWSKYPDGLIYFA